MARQAQGNEISKQVVSMVEIHVMNLKSRFVTPANHTPTTIAFNREQPIATHLGSIVRSIMVSKMLNAVTLTGAGKHTLAINTNLTGHAFSTQVRGFDKIAESMRFTKSGRLLAEWFGAVDTNTRRLACLVQRNVISLRLSETRSARYATSNRHTTAIALSGAAIDGSNHSMLSDTSILASFDKTARSIKLAIYRYQFGFTKSRSTHKTPPFLNHIIHGFGGLVKFVFPREGAETTKVENISSMSRSIPNGIFSARHPMWVVI